MRVACLCVLIYKAHFHLCLMRGHACVCLFVWLVCVFEAMHLHAFVCVCASIRCMCTVIVCA